MKVTVKPYNQQEHYQLLCKWWKEWGWTDAVPAEVLPEGLVVEIDDKLAAAGFIYFTQGTKMSFMDFVVGDKEISSARRFVAVSLVIDSLKKRVAEVLGQNSWIYTLSSHKAYLAILEREGFKLGENNMRSMYYKIGTNANKGGFLD